MINKIKDYLEFRKNKKIVKKEMAKIGSNILPLVSNGSKISKDIIMFIIKLSNELNHVGGDKFVEMLINKVSEVLHSDNQRIIEIFTYIAQLSPRDIQNILLDAVVNTKDS